MADILLVRIVQDTGEALQVETPATTPPLSGTKVYYVSDSSGGAVTRKLTFTDGVLTAET